MSGPNYSIAIFSSGPNLDVTYYIGLSNTNVVMLVNNVNNHLYATIVSISQIVNNYLKTHEFVHTIILLP